MGEKGLPPRAGGGAATSAWLKDGTLHIRFQDESEKRFVFGRSAAVEAVVKGVLKAAPSEASILILGESGVGKGLLSRIIHLLSRRANNRFVKADCAAMAESLIESELFGHERGAFTGATASRPGRFELAQGGTVFLDEVANYSPSVQSKLLRVLQEKEFERVGGTETLKANVRVLAATNQDLEALCRRGDFRWDLYYRLNVITLHLPPLRERREDIPLLVGEFLSEYARVHGGEIPVLDPGALHALTEYDWPGNVRELQNCIERMVVMRDDGRIRRDQIPLLLRPRGLARTAGSTLLRRTERERLAHALLAHHGNKSAAARSLSIDRATLYRRMRKYGMLARGGEGESRT